MKTFKKHYKIILLFLILAVFLFTRLVSLTSLPIFTDEAIYLRWAQTAKNDSNWRFISLTDGKQPLFIWTAMLAMKIFTDPLVAGRVVSASCGLVSLIFLYLLANELFKNKRIGEIAVLLYLLYPSALFYDRLALMDGMLTTAILASLYFTVRLVKTPKLDIALLLGFAMGLSILTKSSGFFTIYFLPVSLLLFDFKNKNRIKRLFSWLWFALIAGLLSQIIYGVLRLSPFYSMVAIKDATFIYPFREWITHPFLFFWGNLIGLTDWMTWYLSWPILALVIFSLLFYKDLLKEKLYLLFWFTAPFISLAFFGKVLYPRFIFFMTIPLIILASYSFELIRGNLSKLNKFLPLLLCLLLLPWIIFDSYLLTDIKNAPLTKIDKGQYVNDWPAGWGVKETVKILESEAKNKKITIITDGTFGLMPYALELYLVYNPNVTIRGIWPFPEVFPKEIEDEARKKTVFFVGNERQMIPANYPLKLIAKWPKGTNKDSTLRLYKVKTL